MHGPIVEVLIIVVAPTTFCSPFPLQPVQTLPENAGPLLFSSTPLPHSPTLPLSPHLYPSYSPHLYPSLSHSSCTTRRCHTMEEDAAPAADAHTGVSTAPDTSWDRNRKSPTTGIVGRSPQGQRSRSLVLQGGRCQCVIPM